MKILFICTHNSCRSILAEAIATQSSEGLIEARSAGSQPAGEVHPLTLQYLQEAGYSTTGLQSESWESVADFAPHCVVTVCDSAAGESCPLWMGTTPTIHWGLSDPSKIPNIQSAQREAFMATIGTLETRIASVVTAINSGRELQEIISQMRTMGHGE